MIAEFDQRAWLARIGYSGSLEPTLSTLHQVIFAHSRAIAYESLDIMLGRIPRLDLISLQRKMITDGRGGYCLEQNKLFREGLRSLGYNITSLQGRVVRGMAIDASRPAIHMLLQVNLPEGPYLADVDFGNLAPTAALLLRPGVEQATPHETMRFIDIGGELTLQSRLRDTWEHIYRVIPYPRYDGEYEITNWYTSTHPDTPYQSNIIAARPGRNRTRLTMFNARHGAARVGRGRAAISQGRGGIPVGLKGRVRPEHVGRRHPGVYLGNGAESGKSSAAPVLRLIPSRGQCHAQ